MLKLRILTAVLLVPPLLAAMFFLPSIWVAALFGIFIAAGAWEWTRLMGLQNTAARLVYSVLLLLTGAVLLTASRDVATLLFAIAALGWIVALVELVRRPVAQDGWFAGRMVRGVIGFFILVPSWVATYTLHVADPQRPSLLLFALVLVWVADSMAYFAGHAFGRTKLAPAISPGKTVEGVLGGVISAALVAVCAGALIWHYTGSVLAAWVTLSVVTALFSVLGDLLESNFKRIAGVKDSGQLLPGHGGALDRIDALTAALPVFALGWHLWFRPV